MRISFILCIFIVGFLGCRKSPIVEIRKNIEGNWELSKTIGFVGTLTYPPGNGTIITFKGKNFFQRKENNMVSSTGTYLLKINNECGSDYIAITTTEGSFQGFNTIETEGDSLLSIGTPQCVADGGATIYRKLR